MGAQLTPTTTKQTKKNNYAGPRRMLRFVRFLIMYHQLKTDPDVFAAVKRNEKKFEIRLNDRDFKVGDTLALLETKYTGEAMHKDLAPLVYTNRAVEVRITHILHGGIYGLAPEWVIMSIEHVDS